MVDFGTRDFGLRNPRSNGSLPRELLFPLSSSFSLLCIQLSFSPFSEPSMLVDDSLSFPFHFALYCRALLLSLPVLHRRYFILTASLRRAVIVIIKKKEKNENEKREKPTSPPPRRKSTMARRPIISASAKTYIAGWLVPDNFRDDISQLHDSQPLIRIMARLKKHFEMPRAIWSRDFVFVEMVICKGFSGINNHNANALQDCDIWRKIITWICLNLYYIMVNIQISNINSHNCNICIVVLIKY